MLISPTEPPQLRAIGTTSNRPEDYGADAMFAAGGRTIGVQRKEVRDLVSSTENGLLGKELRKMNALDHKLLVVEGRMTFTLEGLLTGKFAGPEWTRDHVWGVLLSIQQKGVWVHHTDDLALTIKFLHYFEKWCRKTKHISLDTRPGPSTLWGSPTEREFATYMLQGIPGVGPELAGRVYDLFGRLPWTWSCDPEELMGIEGVGPKKVEAMMRALA